MGVPAAGPADPLSMALANRLVRNGSDACAIEIPFGMFAMEAQSETNVGLAGAPVAVTINGSTVPMHTTLSMRAGDVIELGPSEVGARVYLAAAGGFKTDEFLGSGSTYLPAGFGGFQGRALKAGDLLEAFPSSSDAVVLETPEHMRQVFAHSLALRCVPGPDELEISGWETAQDFVASRRADRTGIEVTGAWPRLQGAALKPSAPVFPGAVQLTPSGAALCIAPGFTDDWRLPARIAGCACRSASSGPGAPGRPHSVPETDCRRSGK